MVTYASLENKFLKACADSKYPKSGKNYSLFLVAWNEARLATSRYGSLNIRKNSIRKFILKPSVSLMRVIEGQHCLIIPEVSAGFGYAPFSQKGRVAITGNNGVLLANNEIAINRKTLHWGAGVVIAGGFMELNTGYERLYQDNYVSDTGIVGLRVNI